MNYLHHIILVEALGNIKLLGQGYRLGRQIRTVDTRNSLHIYVCNMICLQCVLIHLISKCKVFHNQLFAVLERRLAWNTMKADHLPYFSHRIAVNLCCGLYNQRLNHLLCFFVFFLMMINCLCVHAWMYTLCEVAWHISFMLPSNSGKIVLSSITQFQR